MKLVITVDEKNIDAKVLELLNARIKHILRNDILIQETIDAHINIEVKRKINAAFIGVDLKAIAKSIIESRVTRAMPPAQAVSRSVIKEIKERVSSILGINENEEAIRGLLADEIAQLKAEFGNKP